MSTVVLSAYDVAGYSEGGGHCWAYLQYVHGLLDSGCDVWWLERLPEDADAARLPELAATLAGVGLADRLIAYTGGCDDERRYLTAERAAAERLFQRADLLLNFHYGLDAEMLARFRRTALVDIDPGLLQLWISLGHLSVAPHDVYFTTGETVGTAAAGFSDCGFDWQHIRPVVSLEQWPRLSEPPRDCFTTVSSWWGGEWMPDDAGGWYDNNKRASFLEYASLPAHTSVALELALNTGPDDAEDIAALERNGWRVRHAREVTSTADAYRRYVQTSRGEFSCAKPSCMRLQNAWVSDRTICYLASGRPAVVQHTGPSAELDTGEGLLRFADLDQAVAALEHVNSDYARHCDSARALAEELFDARKLAVQILETSFAATTLRSWTAPHSPVSGGG